MKPDFTVVRNLEGYVDLPMWCESFSAAILTLRVSHAKNDPNIRRIPLKPYTKRSQTNELFIAQWYIIGR